MGGGGGWLRPIAVFSLSLDQAEQKAGDELCQAQVSFAFHFVSFDKRKTM